MRGGLVGQNTAPNKMLAVIENTNRRMESLVAITTSSNVALVLDSEGEDNFTCL